MFHELEIWYQCKQFLTVCIKSNMQWLKAENVLSTRLTRIKPKAIY